MMRGHNRWSATELGMTWEQYLANGGKSGDLQLAFLLPRLERFAGFQGMPAGVGSCNEAVSGGNEVWR